MPSCSPQIWTSNKDIPLFVGVPVIMNQRVEFISYSSPQNLVLRVEWFHDDSRRYLSPTIFTLTKWSLWM